MMKKVSSGSPHLTRQYSFMLQLRQIERGKTAFIHVLCRTTMLRIPEWSHRCWDVPPISMR